MKTTVWSSGSLYKKRTTESEKDWFSDVRLSEDSTSKCTFKKKSQKFTTKMETLFPHGKICIFKLV